MRSGSVSWSDEMYRIVDRDRNWVPRPDAGFLSVYHPDDRDLTVRVITEAVASGEPFVLQHRIQRADGSVRWIQSKGHVSKGPDGEPARMVGTAQDITDRVRAETDLRLTEQRYRRVARAMSDLHGSPDLQARIGSAVGELLLVDDVEVTIVDAGPSTVQVQGAATIVPLMYGQRSLGFIRIGGRANGRPLDDEDVAAAEALGRQAAVTIENARQLEQERDLAEGLRALADAKNEFIATVSHELRTPVSVVLGLSSTLHHHWRKLDDEVIDDAFERMRAQSERLATMISDLLELSQLQAGAPGLVVVPHPVRPVVQRVLEAYAMPAGKTIALRADEDAVAAFDTDALGRVIDVLIDNACRHGGSAVAVDVRGGADGVLVRVTDDGPGIKADLVDRLFDPFAQGGGARLTYGSGLGLGLALGYVEAMGGRIWYEPNEPAGACFCFTLPAAVRG